jgi:type III restriction enzyme
MKIKYDSQQPFQLQAINAIADVFEGQPHDAEAFATALKTRAVTGTQAGLFSEIGAVGNNLLLDEDSILENVQAIQNENGIEPVAKLDGMNFSVEMETGTGKTYVYLRHGIRASKTIQLYQIHHHRSKHCDQRGCSQQHREYA